MKKDLLYLGVSTIILAPVIVCAMCTNVVIVLIGVLYGIALAAVSHHPSVREFILRVYRAQLRLFSGRFICEL